MSGTETIAEQLCGELDSSALAAAIDTVEAPPRVHQAVEAAIVLSAGVLALHGSVAAGRDALIGDLALRSETTSAEPVVLYAALVGDRQTSGLARAIVGSRYVSVVETVSEQFGLSPAATDQVFALAVGLLMRKLADHRISWRLDAHGLAHDLGAQRFALADGTHGHLLNLVPDLSAEDRARFVAELGVGIDAPRPDLSSLDLARGTTHATDFDLRTPSAAVQTSFASTGRTAGPRSSRVASLVGIAATACAAFAILIGGGVVSIPEADSADTAAEEETQVLGLVETRADVIIPPFVPMTPPPPEPGLYPSVTISVNRGLVEVDGIVPDQATYDAIDEQLTYSFGQLATNDLRVETDAISPAWLPYAATLVRSVSSLIEGEVSIDREWVLVNGVARGNGELGPLVALLNPRNGFPVARLGLTD